MLESGEPVKEVVRPRHASLRLFYTSHAADDIHRVLLGSLCPTHRERSLQQPGATITGNMLESGEPDT